MMQPNDSWPALFVGKMATDRISHHLTELVQIVRLCKDGIPDSPSGVPTLWIFLNDENDLGHECITL